MRHRMDEHECVRAPRPCVRDARLIGSMHRIGKHPIQPTSPNLFSWFAALLVRHEHQKET
jgi:hypothetical protein